MWCSETHSTGLVNPVDFSFPLGSRIQRNRWRKFTERSLTLFYFYYGVGSVFDHAIHTFELNFGHEKQTFYSAKVIRWYVLINSCNVSLWGFRSCQDTSLLYSSIQLYSLKYLYLCFTCCVWWFLDTSWVSWNSLVNWERIDLSRTVFQNDQKLVISMKMNTFFVRRITHYAHGQTSDW